MNKSCNLIYIAGLILINCSNAADGYKPLPDPVYKSPPASNYSVQPLLQQCGRGRHRKQNLYATHRRLLHHFITGTTGNQHRTLLPAFLLVTGGLTVCPAPHGDPRLHARRPVRQMATSRQRRVYNQSVAPLAGNH